uniref:Uncharacterized protein n=1 Tax=Tetraselmis sp. GSL018 TaxID=582737 RepID=A0A061S663_9CHLO
MLRASSVRRSRDHASIWSNNVELSTRCQKPTRCLDDSSIGNLNRGTQKHVPGSSAPIAAACSRVERLSGSPLAEKKYLGSERLGTTNFQSPSTASVVQKISRDLRGLKPRGGDQRQLRRVSRPSSVFEVNPGPLEISCFERSKSFLSPTDRHCRSSQTYRSKRFLPIVTSPGASEFSSSPCPNSTQRTSFETVAESCSTKCKLRQSHSRGPFSSSYRISFPRGEGSHLIPEGRRSSNWHGTALKERHAHDKVCIDTGRCFTPFCQGSGAVASPAQSGKNAEDEPCAMAHPSIIEDSSRVINPGAVERTQVCHCHLKEDQDQDKYEKVLRHMASAERERLEELHEAELHAFARHEIGRQMEQTQHLREEAKGRDQPETPLSRVMRRKMTGAALAGARAAPLRPHAGPNARAAEGLESVEEATRDALLMRRLEAVYVSFALFGRWCPEELTRPRACCPGMGWTGFTALIRAAGIGGGRHRVMASAAAAFEELKPAGACRLGFPEFLATLSEISERGKLGADSVLGPILAINPEGILRIHVDSG